jgi:hypothetical protein
MTKAFPKEWVEKTIKLNEHREIKCGDIVVDRDRNKGVVAKIDVPENPSVEDHGTITVWQLGKFEPEADNFVHYAWFNWKSNLRILDE